MSKKPRFKTLWKEFYGEHLSLVFDTEDNDDYIRVKAKAENFENGVLDIFLCTDELKALIKALKKAKKKRRQNWNKAW